MLRGISDIRAFFTEQAAAAAGLEVAHPSAELRHRLDSKIVTTRQRGGRPERTVQTPYGDSGKTTFFIKSAADWDRYAGDIVDQELNIMRRITCRAAAVEAVITRHGTVVGPVMTDLTGYPELTPHKGGWCGNDIFPTRRRRHRRALPRRDHPAHRASTSGARSSSRTPATRSSS